MHKINTSKEFVEQLKNWRHHLHMYPETAFEEKQTAAFVAAELRKMGLAVAEGIGGTGVVGTLKVGDGKTAIGLRADMDALNLPEQGQHPYASKNQGKMHGCGHDGHTATLLGAAQLLSARKNFNGTVRFVFQPAEEPGHGAKAMLADGLLEKFPMDEIYGLHNFPALPAGTFATRVGGISSSEDNFTIHIKGKGGHASTPHLGIDPLVTAAEIITSLQTIVSRNVNPLETAVVTCTELYMDGIHNATPSNVRILGDTRSYTPAMQKLIETRMRDIVEHTCAMNGAGCEFTYTHEFQPAINQKQCVEVAVKAAENIVGKDKVNANCDPWTASEDFGIFASKIPGCFVELGSGTSPVSTENTPLHNATFDYNDAVLATGAEYFAELIRLRLAVK